MSVSRFKRFVDLCNSMRAPLGLSGFHLTYESRKLEDAAAETEVNGAAQSANITLDSTPGEGTEWDLMYLARHELLHCLFGRYSELAKSRWATEEELNVEEERIVSILTSARHKLDITPKHRRRTHAVSTRVGQEERQALPRP